MKPSDLEALERKTTALIELCERLSAENKSLRARENKLQTEYLKQREKNQLVSNKIKAMLERFKRIERTS